MNAAASMDTHEQQLAAVLNEQRLLQQAREALFKQRLMAEEKRRQLLLEQSRQNLLESQYMAYLREKMMANAGAASASIGKPMDYGITSTSTGESATDFQSPLALLALQGARLSQQQQAMTPPAAGLGKAMVARKQFASPLEALGSTLRNPDDPYVDVSAIADPTAATTSAEKSSKGTRKARGGVQIPFPEKLHTMLKEMEEQGKTDIVSFYSHGRAFGVHDIDRFVEEIMPKYFKMGKWNSFARQLNLYGFVRMTTGPDSGGYYHELFLKGRPQLAEHMRRVGVPQGEDRRKNKAKNHGVDPDFYAMKPVV
jgi:hypothetical protein